MKEGILINPPNPHPEIRRNSEMAHWLYQLEAQFLYDVGSEMMKRFFNGLVYPDGRSVPAPLIAFDNLRNYRVLACYDLRPDEYGLMYKITFNTEQYEEGFYPDQLSNGIVWRYGRYAQCETLLHEMVHTWQQHGRGNHPYKGGKETHNAEFVAKCREFGLFPKRGSGVHILPPDKNGPFDILMQDFKITSPGQVEVDGKHDWSVLIDKDKRNETRGKSSLNNWVCPECGIHARIGVKGDPEIIHAPCSEKEGHPVFFVRAIAMLGLEKE